MKRRGPLNGWRADSPEPGVLEGIRNRRKRMKLFAVASMIFSMAAILCPRSGAAVANKNQVTILYDAFGKPSSLKKDWGYSALIEYGGKRILFDTGNNAEFFKQNVEGLKVDLSHLDFVVISHRHGDHTSGLSYVLSVNPNVTIYTPTEVSGFGTLVLPSIMAAINRHDPSLPEEMHYFDGVKQETRPSGSPWPTAHFKQIDETTEVTPGIFIISNISDAPGTRKCTKSPWYFELRRVSSSLSAVRIPELKKSCRRQRTWISTFIRYSAVFIFWLPQTPKSRRLQAPCMIRGKWNAWLPGIARGCQRSQYCGRSTAITIFMQVLEPSSAYPNAQEDSMKKTLALIARILFAVPFGAFGMSHLFYTRDMAGKLPTWLPGGVFWIYFTGVCLLLACAAFVTRIQGQTAAFCLATFLLVIVFTLHIPALKAGNLQMAKMNLLKDISLMGGALTYAVIFSSDLPRPVTAAGRSGKTSVDASIDRA
jgi:uncharacterized membrane protein YphA (DoxX/SURF4 family)